jgi:hypothetical protein
MLLLVYLLKSNFVIKNTILVVTFQDSPFQHDPGP